MSLRLRIFLAFALVALLPSLPVTWVVRDLLDRSFSVGLSPEFEAGLESGAGAARHWLRAERQAFRRDCEALAAVSPDLDRLLAQDGVPALPAKLDALHLGPQTARSLAGDWVADPARLAALRALAPLGAPPPARMLFPPDASRRRFQALLPLGDPVSSWLLLSRPLPPELSEAFTRIVSARQLQAGLRLERDELRRGFLLPFLLVYLVILLLSLLLALLLSRRLTQRLATLSTAARRLGGGDWAVRVPAAGADELARLGRAFNEMAAGLRQQQRRLADLEKMAAWREMARSLAHEIKNPLTPISLMVQEIRDRYPGGDTGYADFLEESSRIVETEVESLRRLSREFSAFARMPELQRAEGDIGALLRDLARLYGSVPVRQDIDPELPVFSFDAEQLRRVFSNLFENALAAMADLPQAERGIGIQAEAAGAFLRVDFRDRGPGVPPELRERVFEPHFTTKGGGMGLGLALVRSVCMLHGGEARLGDEGPGAHFIIELPLTPPASPPDKEVS